MVFWHFYFLKSEFISNKSTGEPLFKIKGAIDPLLKIRGTIDLGMWVVDGVPGGGPAGRGAGGEWRVGGLGRLVVVGGGWRALGGWGGRAAMLGGSSVLVSVAT